MKSDFLTITYSVMLLNVVYKEDPASVSHVWEFHIHIPSWPSWFFGIHKCGSRQVLLYRADWLLYIYTQQPVSSTFHNQYLRNYMKQQIRTFSVKLQRCSLIHWMEDVAMDKVNVNYSLKCIYIH